MAAALALFTSLAYGTSNYLGPRLARDAPYLLVLVVGQGCSLVLAAVVVAAAGAGSPDAGALGWALLAGAGNAAGLLLFYAAAAIGPLSVVTPVASVGIVIPVTVGLVGGESMAAGQIAGIMLAVAGLVLVGRRPGRPIAAIPGDVVPVADHHGADHRQAIVLSLLAAVAFGVFLATIKPAAEESAPWAVAISRLGVVTILSAIALRQGPLASRQPPRRLAMLALPGVLLFAGTLSYAVATREGDLTVVSVLGSLFTIVTVTLAVTLDHERLSRVAWGGVGAAVLGVILLSSP